MEDARALGERLSAWIVLTKDVEDRVLAGDRGYTDRLGSQYVWDSKVPNGGRVAVGDALIIRDGDQLLGAAIVESIDIVPDVSRTRLRCPECELAQLQGRKTGGHPYWCQECRVGVKTPVEEYMTVDQSIASYTASWRDLTGLSITRSMLMDQVQLNKAQHSIRPASWPAFEALINAETQRLKLPWAGLTGPPDSSGGFTVRQVRQRRGQAGFRSSLRKRYGPLCALSGPAPEQVLDAAHLYSFAELGVHHSHGGLLLRRDLHALFDKGLITVSAEDTVELHESLLEFPDYASVHEQPLAVDIAEQTSEWLRMHREQHVVGPR